MWSDCTCLAASEGGGGTAMLAIKDSMSSEDRRWRKAARLGPPPASAASVSSGMVRLVRLVASSANWPRDSLRLPVESEDVSIKCL